MTFYGAKRKNNIKTTTPATDQRFLTTTVESAAVVAVLKDNPTLDDAGTVHSEIVSNYPGGDTSEVYGLDVLRAAYDFSKGFITEIDPPLQAVGVTTTAQAESLAIAIGQWIFNFKDSPDLALLHSQTFVQDTLTQSYWSLP